MDMIALAFTWTIRVFIVCSALCMFRLLRGPRSVDRLTALALLSALILAILVMYGSQEGRALYLDVALVYDVFGFLGLLAIASLIHNKSDEEEGAE
ncbi:K+/H+ antiporter subunit F [Treponema sp.]